MDKIKLLDTKSLVDRSPDGSDRKNATTIYR